MEEKKPLILISNDDGYQSKGICSLVEMLGGLGEIIVCAPESARSGFSCAFSAATPLVLKRQHNMGEVSVWSCNGTPVDCVKIALERLCDGRQPDIVIGGINHGDNSSVNSHYSGTMGIVMEGCMKNIPSVAFSLCNERADADFSPCGDYVRKIVRRVLADGLPQGVCLNVNFPVSKQFEGMLPCRMATGIWENETFKCDHPRGYDYYWMVGNYRNEEPLSEDTDRWALTHNYVSVTPTTMDVTAHAFLADMKKSLCKQ